MISFNYNVTINEPIEPTLQSKFETEKISRLIQDCQDIDILRAIAMELLKLNQQKSAIANWATRRAAHAEQRSIRYPFENRKEFD